MASSSHQGLVAEHHTKPIHFFKVILAPSILEGKLRIPKKFVKNFGECIPKTVVLKLPSGAKWKVELNNCNGEFVFEKGWKEFAAHHSLAHGHFLVFKLESSSQVEVLIFDTSGVEIEYPSFQVQGKEASKTDQPSSSRQFNAADNFYSEYPFFKVVVCSNSPHVPTNFIKTYIKPGEHIITTRFGKRSWKIKLIFYSGQQYSKGVLSGGWATFVKDNALRVGDICFFELINVNSDDMVFKVSIFKHPSKFINVK